MQLITPPEPRTLFPPLLACLPTAFVSPRPPPALLPLLSPILRQRVTLLSGNTSSGSGGWLSLLSWDPKRSNALASKVEGLNPEPHPVSGELELEDIKKIEYRRLDEETLQTCLSVDEFGLAPIYVWCESDEHGSLGPGWRLAELRALEDKNDAATWCPSVSAANDQFESATPTEQQVQASAAAAEDDDDDDYWNSYDRTPGRTPARTPVKRSPVPAAAATANLPSASELEYFARYAAEVQPALDSHDPDEEHPSTADSTLNGSSLSYTPQKGEPNTDPTPPLYSTDVPAPLPNNNNNNNDEEEEKETLENTLTAPRPTSPNSTGSNSSVERLEQEAQDMTRAEIGVKQFISTEVKSLFRLARSVGMGRTEFERVVRTELEVLGMLEVDD